MADQMSPVLARANVVHGRSFSEDSSPATPTGIRRPHKQSLDSNSTSFPQISSREFRKMSAPNIMSELDNDETEDELNNSSRSNLSTSLEDLDLTSNSEDEALEACRWLEDAGFPQYVQCYRDRTFVNTTQLKNDHEFLNEHQIEAVTKRLLILNEALEKSGGEKHQSVTTSPSQDRRNDAGDPAQPTTPKDGEPGGAMRERLTSDPPPTALSALWTFRKDSNKWSRAQKQGSSGSLAAIEAVAMAKVAGQKWFHFVRQRSQKKESDDVELCVLTAREVAVLQRLSLTSLTGILERYFPDPAHSKKWRRTVGGITRLLTPKKHIEYAESAVFGVPLSVIIERTGRPLPDVIFGAMTHLSEIGGSIKGIFRKAGSAARIRELKSICEGRQGLDFSDLPAHDVADLVKQYFRELPEPLLTEKLSPQFIACSKLPAPSLCVQALRLAIALLPDENREVLGVLLGLLSKIARLARTVGAHQGNEMGPSNLATVFAPNLFHFPPSKGSLSKFQGTGREVGAHEASNRCLQVMIEEQANLFSVSSDVWMQMTFVFDEHNKPVPSDRRVFDRQNINHIRLTLQRQIESLQADARDKFRSYTPHAKHSGVKVSVRPPESDAVEELVTWRGVTIVAASPSKVIDRIIRQRHMWDKDIVHVDTVEEVSSTMDVYRFTHKGYGSIPARDYCVVRSWHVTESGACHLVATSVDHSAAPLLAGHVRVAVSELSYLVEPYTQSASIGHHHSHHSHHTHYGGPFPSQASSSSLTGTSLSLSSGAREIGKDAGKDAQCSRVTMVSRIDFKGRTPQWYNKGGGSHDVVRLAELRRSFEVPEAAGVETSV
eukprot:Opistho-2@41343